MFGFKTSMLSHLGTALELIPGHKKKALFLLFLSGVSLALIDAVILLFVPKLFSLKGGAMNLWGAQVTLWTGLIAMGLILGLKNTAFVYFQYIKNQYLAGLQVYFSTRILAANLLAYRRVGKDIGGSISSIIVEPLQLVLNMYGPLINLIVEGSVGILIFAVLLWLSPVASALLGGMMILIIVGYQHFVKSKNQSWGLIRAEADGKRSEWGRAALAGAEEIAVMGATEFIFDGFSRATDVSARMVANKATTTDITKNVIELSVLVSVGSVVLFSYLVLEKSMADMAAMLATFAFSAYRLMPSLNRVMVSMQSIRYAYGPMLNIRKDLEFDVGPVVPEDRHRADTLEIQAEGLTIAGYPIRRFSCRLTRGDILVIKGESGVGKSTFLRALLYGEPGVRLVVNGRAEERGLCGSRTSVAYMGQSPSVLPVDLAANIALARRPIKQRTREYLSRLKMNEVDESSDLEHERLSGGQRSRISFLRGVDYDASIFLFDEPTAALDPALKETMSALVVDLARQAIVIIISHDGVFDEVASQQIVMERNE